MTTNDFLMLLYHYREVPIVQNGTHMLTFIREKRLLYDNKTRIAVAGIVTALCDRHKEQYESWCASFREILLQAYGIANNEKARTKTLWAEYLINRWLILGNDESAWELLCLCHYAASPEQRTAAQSACDKICRSIDGKPMTDSKGNLTGSVYFEDMRLQMLRLAREFSSMTVAERKQPFSRLSFSQETQESQQVQGLGPGAQPGPGTVVIPAQPGALIQ